MKFNSLPLILTLFTFVSSETLECAFQISAVKLYTCLNINLNIGENEIQLENVTGSHFVDKGNGDVRAVYFLSSKMVRLPQNLFTLLPELTRYVVHGLDVGGDHLNREGLIIGDFHGADKLKMITMTGFNLYNVRPRVFEGAENLDFLSLEACGIRKIDQDSFTDLKKLRSLSLNYNLLKSLHNEIFNQLENLRVLMVAGNFITTLHQSLFVHLIKLQKISFANNMLEVIDKNLTKPLTDLKQFFLDQNICVNKNFGVAKVPLSSFENLTQNCTEKKKLKDQIDELKSENEDLKKRVDGLIDENNYLQFEKDDMESRDSQVSEESPTITRDGENAVESSNEDLGNSSEVDDSEAAKSTGDNLFEIMQRQIDEMKKLIAAQGQAPSSNPSTAPASVPSRRMLQKTDKNNSVPVSISNLMQDELIDELNGDGD